MGITLEQAILLERWSRQHALRGRVLTLGVQHLDFNRGQLEIALGHSPASASGAVSQSSMSAEELFTRLGFDGVTAADVSSYEGANVVLDLNDSDVPSDLKGSSGLIVNGGTLEHVFHVPNALSNMTRMLAPGGCILHIMPCHNCVDHGFYQFGPTLVFDYYGAAGFAVLESAVVATRRPDLGRGAQVFPAPEGTFGIGLIGAVPSLEPLLYVALVRKTSTSLEAPVPTQRLYGKPPPRRNGGPRWFVPFSLVPGERPVAAEVRECRLGPFSHVDGFAWSCTLPDFGDEGDAMTAPIRSQLMVFEDGRPLGPPHASHTEIVAYGGGTFSHWGGTLTLSTSDGSDPQRNGRSYVAKMPLFPAAIVTPRRSGIKCATMS